MTQYAITLTMDDRKVRALLKSEVFPKKFNRHMSQQLIGFISYAKAQIARQMRVGSYQPNIVQTIIKGNSTLFVESGRFAANIRAQYVKDSYHVTGVRLGWFKGQTSRGFAHSQLAAMLNTGAEWTPTEAQRLAIMAKVKKAGGPAPNGERQEKYQIPARPFMADTFDNRRVINRFINVVANAVARTVHEMSKG